MGTPPPQGRPSLLHTWGRRRVSATIRVRALKVCDVRMSTAALARQAYHFFSSGPGPGRGKSWENKKNRCWAVYIYINIYIYKYIYSLIYLRGQSQGRQ